MAQVSPQPDRPAGSPVAAALLFIAGAFVAVVIDFVLTLFLGLGEKGIGTFALAWFLTIAAYLGLRRIHPWMGYGLLGGYAALFVLLVALGGATAAYTCFSVYGYPSSYR